MSLGKLRHQIDMIDLQLLELFEERMDLVKEISEYKTEHGLPVLNSNREEEVLQRRLSIAQDHYKDYINKYFVEIMRLSKEYQHSLSDSKDKE